ncbi:MAG: hypothetical protein U0T81_00915 [Saprospiraceae bacterium]
MNTIVSKTIGKKKIKASYQTSSMDAYCQQVLEICIPIPLLSICLSRAAAPKQYKQRNRILTAYLSFHFYTLSFDGFCLSHMFNGVSGTGEINEGPEYSNNLFSMLPDVLLFPITIAIHGIIWRLV